MAGCVFCAIVAGEIPAFRVAADADAAADAARIAAAYADLEAG